MNKVSTKKVEVPTSFCFFADDYHEFKNIQYYLKKYLKLNYSFEEVGCNGSYEAVFYIGRKPKKLIQDIKKMYKESEEC